MFIHVIQSVVVYGLLVWIMTYCGYLAYRSQYPYGFNISCNNVSSYTMITRSYVVFPILFFCLFASIRYRVGVDCESYKLIYYDLVSFGESFRAPNIEVGFKHLASFTSFITDSHYLFFFILAFMQIVCYYIAFSKERYVLFYLFLAIFLTGHYWSLMNGMRQNIAACIFVAIIPSLVNKRWLWLLVGTFIATTMHRSSVLIIPLGIFAFLCRNKILNKYWQILILIVCFLLMNKLNNIFTPDVMNFASQVGYEAEEIDSYAYLGETETRFGLTMSLQYLVYCIAILYSDKLSSLYNTKLFNSIYNLFFLGICMTLIFYNNFTMKRIIYYLMCFAPIVVSYLLFYFWNKRKTSHFYMTILLLFIQLAWSIYSSVSKGGPFEVMLYKFDL